MSYPPPPHYVVVWLRDALEMPSSTDEHQQALNVYHWYRFKGIDPIENHEKLTDEEHWEFQEFLTKISI